MPSKRSGLPIVTLVVIFLVFAGDVQDGAPANHGKPHQYTVPEATNDGWETAHVSSEHIDAEVLKTLFDRIINETYKNIHSVLLVKNDKLVVEEYFQPWHGNAESGDLIRALDRVTMHQQHSVTKSVTSLLIGIAIDQQLMRGVEEKIAAFFPEYADIFADSAKDMLRLQHFLAMTALAWDERTYPLTDARNDHVSLNRSKDPIRYALERPVIWAPGTQFVYNSGMTITLGEIIYKVSGMRADKFAERYLFAPLGISSYYWWKYPNGTVQTGGGLSAAARHGQNWCAHVAWRSLARQANCQRSVGQRSDETARQHWSTSSAGGSRIWVSMVAGGISCG